MGEKQEAGGVRQDWGRGWGPGRKFGLLEPLELETCGWVLRTGPPFSLQTSQGGGPRHNAEPRALLPPAPPRDQNFTLREKDRGHGEG